MKEPDKTSEKAINEIRISDLSYKEFRIMVIKVLTKFLRRMDEHSENVNKEIENIAFSSRVIRTKWKKKQMCMLKHQRRKRQRFKYMCTPMEATGA